ncbi:MAG: hypothetical protein ACE5FO_01410 [Parvularculaceae bacterium]
MRLITLSAILALASPASFANDLEDFASSFNAGAFDDFDAKKLRLIANRYSECGSFGDSGKTRAELLVSRYRALAEAITAGDESQTMEKVAAFVRAAEANSRFEKCWTRLRRKSGVPSDFVNEAKSILDA